MKKQMNGMQQISLAGPIREEKAKEEAKRAKESTSQRGEAKFQTVQAEWQSTFE